MAYYRPRNPKPPNSQVQGLKPVDIWEVIKSPLAGIWEGSVGSNRSFEQYINDKRRRRQGLDPMPGRGMTNWLRRQIIGK